MKFTIYGHLRLHFEENPIAVFFPLLQQGFYLEIGMGNIQHMLSQMCDIEPGYVRKRIQTVFLNGKPVDDMATAYVQDGDELALSAALPGLVGATMRSGGVLAGFRRSISHQLKTTQSKAQRGILLIKLFNLLIKDIGPRFLQQGILVGTDDLRTLLTSILEADLGNCTTAQLNTRTMTIDALAEVDWPVGPELIRLEVTFGPTANTAPSDFASVQNKG
jgi:hypothetical protein